MPTIKPFAFALLLALTASLLATAGAQTPTISTVNLSAERDRVIVSAQGEIAELRLEVINPAGEIVFDSGPVSAASLEWPMRDSQGARVADGVYLCTISYRNSAGKLRKRIEQVTVTAEPQIAEARESAPLAPTTITGSGTAGQLSKFTSSSTIGNSVVTESAGKIGVGTAAPTATLHVNNGVQPAASATNGTSAPTLLQTAGGKGGNTTGTTGQVAGAGASISLLAGNGGDAPTGSNNGMGGSITLQPGGAGAGAGVAGKSGNVLIAPSGGNVGIGTTTPAAKLTVAGVIQSTTGGIKFPDNTVQTSAASGLSNVVHDSTLAGSGTTGSPLRVSPTDSNFIHNGTTAQTANLDITGSGTLGGNLTTLGALGVGTTTPLRTLQLGSDTNALFTLSPTDGTPNAGYIRFGDHTGWKLHIARNRECSQLSCPQLNTGTTGELMTIQDNGNVGIGNISPTFRLHVVDTANTGLRVQTNTGGGTVASFGGNGDFQIDAVNVVGGRLTVKEAGNVGIGTSAPQAALDVRGDVKLGTTGQYFAPGGEENLRIIRGYFDQAGNVDLGSGFTVTRNSKGDYTINFNTPFSAPPIVTAICGIDNNDGNFTVNIPCIVSYNPFLPQDTTTAFEFNVFDKNGNFADGVVFFIAIGPK